MCKGYDASVERGLLTAAEAAELKAQARRCSSGANEVRANAVGISTADIERMCKLYEDGAKLGLLSAADAAELKARARRYSTGSRHVNTSAVSNSTVQWSTREGKVEEISALSQSDVDDLERLFGGGRTSLLEAAFMARSHVRFDTA